MLVSKILILLPSFVSALPARRDPISSGGDRAYNCALDSRSLPADCRPLVEDCAKSPSRYSNPWSVSTCVAASFCTENASGGFGGPAFVLNFINCYPPFDGVITLKQSLVLPNLDYKVYAEIVGPCAYAPGGCPITEQNFLDFYYKKLEDLKSKSWPDSPVMRYWKPVQTWAKTPNNSIPYKNFNDFLHFYSKLDSGTTQLDKRSCDTISGQCSQRVDNTLSDPFSHIECVLAAICTASNFDTNTDAVLNYVQQRRVGEPANFIPQHAIDKPRLSHAVFQKLSGNGNVVTLQTLTDAYYAQASTSGGPYPVSTYYIQILNNFLKSWTGQCSGGIAEGNLADYLQFSTTVQSNVKC